MKKTSLRVLFLVPEQGSDVLRRTVEALFITHAETKLNTTGRLVDHPPIANIPIDVLSDRGQWCHSLVRRPHPSSH